MRASVCFSSHQRKHAHHCSASAIATLDGTRPRRSRRFCAQHRPLTRSATRFSLTFAFRVCMRHSAHDRRAPSPSRARATTGTARTRRTTDASGSTSPRTRPSARTTARTTVARAASTAPAARRRTSTHRRRSARRSSRAGRRSTRCGPRRACSPSRSSRPRHAATPTLARRCLPSASLTAGTQALARRAAPFTNGQSDFHAR